MTVSKSPASLINVLMVVAATAGTAAVIPAQANDGLGFYVRGGVGYEQSLSSTFSDRNCSASSPPALFGCAIGDDGRSIAGRGDFGDTVSFEAALGFRPLEQVRVEAAISHRPGFSFSGDANFVGITGAQPVRGNVEQSSAIVFGYLELAPLLDTDFGRIEPFIGGGVGVSQNSIDSVTYSFPDHSNPGYSRTSGGTRTDLAWAVTAGTGIKVTDSVTIDLSYRYSDYGRVQTDPGDLRIVRQTFDTTIPIDATEARLTSHAVMTGVRYSF